jgi:hypothetical protein
MGASIRYGGRLKEQNSTEMCPTLPPGGTFSGKNLANQMQISGMVPRRDVAQAHSINSLLQGEGAKSTLNAKSDFQTFPHRFALSAAAQNK